MKFERLPPMPAKSRLSWQISRLRLDASGRGWLATGVKRELTATIVLPLRELAATEESWLASIEEAFEQRARSVFDTDASEGAAARGLVDNTNEGAGPLRDERS